MDLTPFMDIPRSFILLQAPPAWGKTRILLRQIASTPGIWIFLSPLRALAEEFFRNGQAQCASHIMRHRSDWEKLKGLSHPKKPVVIVTTPECLALEKALINFAEARVIVDEFHLFHLWGHSFRPQMWEALLGLACECFSVIGLSATMNNEVKREWRQDFPLAFDTLVEVDLGNQSFKYPPERIHYFSRWGGKWFNRRFLYHLLTPGKETLLYFCRYRAEVDAWLRFCRRQGINALGCKGGEVPDFIAALDFEKPPRAIFSTSALSHGVNLPTIRKVFLSYPTKSEDFWLQMSTRAGRDGQGFEVYTLEGFHTTLRERVACLARNFLLDVLVRFILLWKML